MLLQFTFICEFINNLFNICLPLMLKISYKHSTNMTRLVTLTRLYLVFDGTIIPFYYVGWFLHHNNGEILRLNQ